MEKIKLVVIENHTLGYVIPNSDYAGILHSSVLRGAISASPLSALDPIIVKGKEVRLASKRDFDDFRVSFAGFDNGNEYEFAKS